MKSDNWHYLVSGNTQGPVTRAEIATLVRSGQIQPTTLVWHPSMQDWMPAIETKLSAVFDPQRNLRVKRARPRSAQALTEEQYFICAVLGLVAATLSSVVSSASDVPPQIHGLIFPVVLSAYFYWIGLMNGLRVASCIALTLVGYVCAYAISYNLFEANPEAGLAIPGLGSGAIGFLIPMLMFVFLKEKPRVSPFSYIFATVPFALYGMFVMPLAAQIEKPTLGYPEEFGTSMLIHAPWQAAFAVVLAFFLSKSSFRG